MLPYSAFDVVPSGHMAETIDSITLLFCYSDELNIQKTGTHTDAVFRNPSNSITLISEEDSELPDFMPDVGPIARVAGHKLFDLVFGPVGGQEGKAASAL